MCYGAVAQLGERGLCKPEVVGSIPSSSTPVDAERLQQDFTLAGFPAEVGEVTVPRWSFFSSTCSLTIESFYVQV
jgi:hypothetical protein